jgi:signal transduction histidine kinase
MPHKTIPDILQTNKPLDAKQDMTHICEQHRQIQGRLKRIEQRLEAALTETRSLIYDLQQRS